MERFLEQLIWRLTWWLVRLFWFPALVISFAYYVVLPALAELVRTPLGLLLMAALGAGFLLWLWHKFGRLLAS